MKNYYEILRVDPRATDEVIKRTYRNLAKTYHPDANPDNKAAEAAFQEISEAYAALLDVDTRRRLDLELGLAASRSSAASRGRESPRHERAADECAGGSERQQQAHEGTHDRSGEYVWSSTSEGTPIAVFASRSKWAGKRLLRRIDELYVEGGAPIQASTVVEEDSRGHVVWRFEGLRAWTVTRAAAEGSAPRPTSPLYNDPGAPSHIERARTRFKEGRFKAAIEELWWLETSAQRGDATAARFIVELAGKMRAQVEPRLCTQCDELTMLAQRALRNLPTTPPPGSAASSRAAATKQSVVGISTVIAVIWVVLVIVRIIAAASQ